MIDKKVLTVVAVLLILALMILAVAVVRPSFGGGGTTFSELFDKLEKENLSSEMLVIGEDFEDGQEIIIEDEIISMRTHGSSTTFYFLYSGDKWEDEEEGTNFHVPTDSHYIDVNNAYFSIGVSGIFSSRFDVHDMITLKTAIVEDEGLLVFDHDWEVL